MQAPFPTARTSARSAATVVSSAVFTALLLLLVALPAPASARPATTAAKKPVQTVKLRQTRVGGQKITVSGTAALPAARRLKKRRVRIVVRELSHTTTLSRRHVTLKPRSRAAAVPFKLTFSAARSGRLAVLVSLQINGKRSGAVVRRALVVPPAPQPRSQLPIFEVTTDGGVPVVEKSTYLPASLNIRPNGSDVDPLTTALEIKGRGNFTWHAPKKPFRLKLADRTPLLHMPPNKHWVLLANYYDNSFARTSAAMFLGRMTSLDWTPRGRFVEVVLNGQKLGLYQLMEHVRVGSGRVDITEMKPTDTSGEALTGGYLLEIEMRKTPAEVVSDGNVAFVTDRGTQMIVNSPDPPVAEQLDYIRDHITELENALFSSDFADPVVGYAAWIDVPSFIDWYLVNELVRNRDSFQGSTWFNKERGGKLKLGPLWDYDLSLGNPHAADLVPEGWWVRPTSPWFTRLFEDPAFARAVAERWFELQQPGRFPMVHTTITNLKDLLGPAAAADRVLWGHGFDFKQEVDDVNRWLTLRSNWLSERFAEFL